MFYAAFLPWFILLTRPANSHTLCESQLMKTAIFTCITFTLSLFAEAQNEPFTKRTVISGLNSPWEITYGPNDSLWVTENVSYLVKRINIITGAATTLLNLSGLKNFSAGDGGRWPQGGLMGMALHPNLYSYDPSVRAAKPWVYLAYVYDRPAGQTCSTNANSSNACNFHTRIVRYTYSGNTLSNPVIILDALSGSNDHNSGRLKVGPDLKLYYTIGDMGAGQFNNAARTNNAQNVDVLEGKVLRLNTEPDNDGGADDWVPNDNPYYDETSITARDYVFTMGHRNAQGLVWADVNGNDILYNSEHGDRSDDEVNMLVAGKNYGWNRVSGYCDGNYNGLTLGGYSPVNETNFCTVNTTAMEPLKTFFSVSQATINALGSDYLTWPTIAPSSIDYYASGPIPGWSRSLLITCLKAGRVYRIKLNSTGDDLLNISGSVDTASLFRGEGRFRDLAISPNGMKIYLACDASGQTSGPTGGFNNGGTPPPNAGSILEYSYAGTILALPEEPTSLPVRTATIRTYPNPVTDNFVITISEAVLRPYHIEIFDALGTRLRTYTSVKHETIADLSGLKAGMYVITVTNAYGQRIATEKIVKQ